MKLKLDKQAIQGFFVHHVEKLVLIVLVLTFVWMGYAAATRPKYDRQPQELVTQAERADENIERPRGIPPDLKLVKYLEIAKRSRDAVSETPYVLDKPLDKPIWAESLLRSEPPLFPAEKLVANASVGTFLMKSGPTGQQQAGQRWIVLTGLVPTEKQVQAYRETFKDLKRPETDTPQYIHFWVERAELSGDARDANPNWVGINVAQARQGHNLWASSAQEVVAAEYLLDPIVFPLGPMMNASWDERVAHPPEIPLASAAPAKAPTGPGKPVPPPDRPPMDMPPDAKTKRVEDMPAVPGAAAPGAPGAAPAAPGPGTAAPGAAGAPAMGMGMGAAEGVAAGHEGQSHQADVTAVQHLLLRFFDFSVEPGKRYAYRVKLLLANPNLKYEVRYLTDPTLAEKRWIETEWSEPCAPVFVSRDDRLLVKSVKAPPQGRIATAEPVATATLVKWLVDHGTEASEEFKILRGQLANLSSGTALVAESEETPDAPVPAGLIEEEKPSRKSVKESAGPKVIFKSDNLLLDMRGGEKWRGQAVEPGELLLLDYDGSLSVRTELDDFAVLPKAKEKTAEIAGVEEASADKAKGKKKEAGSDLFKLQDDGGKKPKREKPIGKKKQG